jgi:hypothetical protein
MRLPSKTAKMTGQRHKELDVTGSILSVTRTGVGVPWLPNIALSGKARVPRHRGGHRPPRGARMNRYTCMTVSKVHCPFSGEHDAWY